MEKLLRRAFQIGVLGSVLLAGAPGTSAYSQNGLDVHLCVHKTTGQVRIVAPDQACHTQERRVEWTFAAPTPTPTPTPAPGFEIVDGQNTVLGPVVGVAGSVPVVGLRIGELAFALGVANNALFGSDFAFFAAADCSGTAYLRRSFGLFPTAAVDHLGRVHVDNGQGTPAPVNLAALADGSGCVSFGGTFPVDVVPGTQVAAPGTFVAPFRLR